MAPQVMFGTATFGMHMSEFQDTGAVKQLLQTLLDLGVHRLDTGARYPPLNPGRAEELIGEAKELSRKFVIDTKIYTNTQTDGSGDLTIEAIERSTSGSLQRLQKPEGVNVLYIHRPDPATPLEDQVRGFQEQIERKQCQTWGVSNMPPDLLKKILEVCEQNGWPKPSHYQGTYNLISRGMESTLLPLLRAHGMTFVCFGSVASGFLTGKFVNNEHSGTRLGDDNPLGKHFQRIYGTPDLLDAMRKFDREVRAHGITPVEVAVRWIFYHSQLCDSDAVLLGASKIRQLIENMAYKQRGRLPEAILPLVEELWSNVKASRAGVF
ncbi:putative oxidoreductase [Xylariaceae sp. FL0016]|nr:putative oxidoreductase [Xylariaceae sp. FL0016]